MEIVNQWIEGNLNQGAIFAMLIAVFGMLLSIRFTDRLNSFVKMRRIWWRLVLVVLTCIVSFPVQMEVGMGLWLILPIAIICLAFATVFYLPHEQLIISNVNSSDAKTRWIFTTHGKIAFELAKAKAASTEHKQEAYYRYFKFIKQRELLPFEIADYYEPILEEIYQIGATKLVKEEIEKLEQLNPDNKRLLTYKAFVAYSELRLADMRSYLEEYLEQPDLTLDERVIAKMNLLCVANETNDKSLYEECIRFAEDAYFNHNYVNTAIVGDLMFYCDEHGIRDKAEQMVERLKKIKYTSISRLFEYADIIFNHYRKLDDVQGQLDALQMIINKQAEAKDDTDKSRLIVDLSIMAPLFNVNGNWRQYSSYIFSRSQIYLNHSHEVAMAFITETMRIMRDADRIYHQFIPDFQYFRLVGEMKEAIAKWELILREEIAKTPKDMLYKRKSLQMRLVEMTSVKLEGTEDLVQLTKEKLEIIESIINECRDNCNTRELLHFLNVYCDEVLTVHCQLLAPGLNVNQIEIDRYMKKYDEYYKPRAIEYIKEMESIILPNKNNKSLNFYVLYLAHFFLLLRDDKQGTFYFHLFESYDIDTKYFNTVHQDMYARLSAYVYRPAPSK